MSNRLDELNKIIDERAQIQRIKENMDNQLIDKYYDEIKALMPRIHELLLLANICLQHNITIKQGAPAHQYYNQNHFMSPNDLSEIGFLEDIDLKTGDAYISGIGIRIRIHDSIAWKYYIITLLKVTDVDIVEPEYTHPTSMGYDYMEMKINKKDRISYLMQFINEFGNFETKFFQYIDTIINNNILIQ